MKKLFLILIILLLCCNYSLATGENYRDDAIYLDNAGIFPKNPYSNTSKIINNQKYNLKTQPKNQITPQNIYDYKDKDDPFQQHSASFLHEKQYGNFSIGTKSEYKISPDKYSSSSTYFAKYNRDKFSFDTSLKNGGLTSFNGYKNNTLSFTPEYKLNNHVTLQNIYSTNFLDRNRKNELIFSLKPFKDDRMNFDIGAGQIYSDNATPIRSQFNFSTKFKF